jgi:hypothetical protein
MEKSTRTLPTTLMHIIIKISISKGGLFIRDYQTLLMSTIYASDMRRTKTVYIESTHKPTQPRGNLY